MNKAIERRLVAAEQQLTPPRAMPQVILIRGGLHGDDPTFATAGDLRRERAPNESFVAFRARAVTAATTADEPFIVFGGLPA
jgi:hypothetical protein